MVVGAVILHRLPRHPVGRLLLACGLGVELADALDALASHGGRAAPALAAAVLFAVAEVSAATVLPLLYPDGVVPTGAARWLLRAAVLDVAVLAAGVLITPGPIDDHPLQNPLAGPAAVASLLVTAGGAGALALMAAGIVRLGSRWRRAGADDRAALAWLALAGALALLLVTLSLIPHPAGTSGLAAVLQVLAVSSFPVATGIAVLRRRLFDIELVLRRTLAYASLTLLVVAVYALAIAALGDAFSQLGVSLLVSGVAAVLLSPLREAAQAAVDRLLYGRRSDPYGVLRDLDFRLAAAVQPSEVLPLLVRTVSEALRLPYVGVELVDGGGASVGGPAPIVRRLGIEHYGRTIGELLVSARSPGEGLSGADERLLRHVAAHAGGPVAAVAFAQQAQQSRERLVHALEDDRRRVRRDLHDGLGPTLSGVRLQLDALARLTRESPDAHQLAVSVRDEVVQAVANVRRLVHGLRPPVLDELGLPEALTRHGQRLAAALDVEVVADVPAPLPAAVEVAAYRIATEALENVVRHAMAREASVRLSLAGERLRIEVADDGTGFAEGHTPGVGLRSMHERAAELGGFLQVEQRHPGSRIVAELPL